MENLPRITQSPMLPHAVRQRILQQELAIISGQPVWHISHEGKELFHDDCAEAIDMPFFVSNALIKVVPSIGHRHIPEKYHGEYVILIGVNPETNDEYCFGIRDELNFNIRNWTDSVA